MPPGANGDSGDVAGVDGVADGLGIDMKEAGSLGLVVTWCGEGAKCSGQARRGKGGDPK